MTACSPFHAEDPLLDGSNSSGALGGDPVAQEKAMAYLQSNCLGCHGANGSGGVSNITDINHLIASGLIVPGNPTAGRLIGSMEDGSMPTAQRASTADLQIIRDWLGSDWQAGGTDLTGVATRAAAERLHQHPPWWPRMTAFGPTFWCPNASPATAPIRPMIMFATTRMRLR